MLFTFLTVTLLMFSCAYEENARHESPRESRGRPFTGTVVYNNLEGGFYGVVTDTGQQLDGTLPRDLRRDGLRVRGEYERALGQMGIRMWGEQVRFLWVERVTDEYGTGS